LPTLAGQGAQYILYSEAAADQSLFFNEVSGPGYNEATGLGSPIAPAVIAGLSGNLPAPTAISPSGTFNFGAPETFQWSAVPGATSYILTITDTSTQGSGPLTEVVTNGATSFTASAGSFFGPGVNYSWQVIAGNEEGTSAASNSLNVTVPGLPTPTLISPTGSVVGTATPTLSWAAVQGAAYYSVYVYTYVAGEPSAIVPVTQVSGTSYTLSTPLTSGVYYYWSVIANFSYYGLDWESAASSDFLVATLQPTGLSPASGAVVGTSTPTFAWQSSGVGVTYLFSLTDDSANFETLVDYMGVAGTTYTPSVPLADGNEYTWSVSAVGATVAPTLNVLRVSLASGGTGTVSTPTNLAPSGVVDTLTPTLQWSPVLGATGYGVYLWFAGGSNAGDTVAAPAAVNTPSYVIPSGELSYGSFYVFYVVAYDDTGDVSGLSAGGLFMAASTGATITLTAPGVGVSTFAPTFSWLAVSGATDYTLAVFDQSSINAASGVSSYLADESDVTTTSCTPNWLEIGQVGDSITWYVTAYTSPNTAIAASSGTFTLGVPVVATITPISPAAGAVLNALTFPTGFFQWAAVSGASGYYVFLENVTESGPWQVLGGPASGDTNPPSYPISSGWLATLWPGAREFSGIVDGDTYEWYVAAIGTSQALTSSPQTFTVSVPGIAVLSGPIRIVATQLPTFTWSDSDTAAVQYQLYVEDNTTKQMVIDGTIVSGTSHTPRPRANAY
jgi:hypothetical protein